LPLGASPRPAPGRDELVARVRSQAEDLFASRRLLCAGAVLQAVNQCFGGGLDPAVAARLVAGLPEGMGGAGCICGALSGAGLALGLLLGDGAYRVPPWAGRLPRRFQRRFGSTCCRVLRRQTREDPRADFQRCTRFTGAAAAMAAEIILDERPGLLLRAGGETPRCRAGRLPALWRRLAAAVRGG